MSTFFEEVTTKSKLGKRSRKTSRSVISSLTETTTNPISVHIPKKRGRPRKQPITNNQKILSTNKKNNTSPKKKRNSVEKSHAQITKLDCIINSTEDDLDNQNKHKTTLPTEVDGIPKHTNNEDSHSQITDELLYYNIVTTKRDIGKRKVKPKDYVIISEEQLAKSESEEDFVLGTESNVSSDDDSELS